MSLDVSAVPARMAGAGRYIAQLARCLAKRPDVALSLLARADDAPRWEGVEGVASVVAAAPGSRPLRLAWEQASLPRRLKKLGVELHHSPHYTMPDTSAVARVVTFHDTTVFDHPEWHERSKVLLFRHAMKVAAKEADALVCVSRSTADRVRDLLPTKVPLHVVHHGVDHDTFRPDEEVSGSDKAILAGLGVHKPYVAFVGTVEPRKDVVGLVRAFDRIASAHESLSLVVAGVEGWAENQLARAIGEARHGDRILRVGYLPHGSVAPLFRGASAVSYPSLEEGFGLPVLEALACGAPVVTTTGSAMEEFAKGAALLVPPKDEYSLAGALDMLVRGDSALANRRRRGLELAAGFTWEASAEGHMAAYRDAMDHFGDRAGQAKKGRI